MVCIHTYFKPPGLGVKNNTATKGISPACKHSIYVYMCVYVYLYIYIKST